jgi:hypothetical protein
VRRLPNPWFLIPVAIAALVGAVLGREVARVTCTFGSTDSTGCPGLEISAAVVGGLVGLFGVAVMLVLAFRSIAEWREAQAKGRPPPEPGCEAEPDPGEQRTANSE